MNQQELASKTSSELVKIFNAIPGVTPTKKFSSKDNGIRRILKALADNPTAAVDDAVAQKPVETKKVAKPKTERANAATVGTYDRPEGARPVAHRANSKIGKLIAAGAEGATFEQLLEVTGWDAPTLHKKILTANWYYGYGLSTKDGVIRIFHSANS